MLLEGLRTVKLCNRTKVT